MNDLSPSLNLPRPERLPMQQQPRTDLQHSSIVERGIVVQATCSTVCALEYLQSYNVSRHVIERVLLYPQQRRSLQVHDSH